MTDKLTREFKKLEQTYRIAPGPINGPEWASEGVENLFDFFNSTAHLWDQRFSSEYAELHRAVAAQIPETDAAITLLDVGCGTGLELEYIFARAPNEMVTAMDFSPRMLAALATKYADLDDQIQVVEASCIEWPTGLGRFDFVVSVLCVHHFPPETKLGVYSNFRNVLVEGGVYIEGDQATTPAQEREGLALYHQWIEKLQGGAKGEWNYDVTLTPETNQQLMREAGFPSTAVRWATSPAGEDFHVVLVATEEAICKDFGCSSNAHQG